VCISGAIILKVSLLLNQRIAERILKDSKKNLYDFAMVVCEINLAISEPKAIQKYQHIANN
jgi:hypothetical protein